MSFQLFLIALSFKDNDQQKGNNIYPCYKYTQKMFSNKCFISPPPHTHTITNGNITNQRSTTIVDPYFGISGDVARVAKRLYQCSRFLIKKYPYYVLKLNLAIMLCIKLNICLFFVNFLHLELNYVIN